MEVSCFVYLAFSPVHDHAPVVEGLACDVAHTLAVGTENELGGNVVLVPGHAVNDGYLPRAVAAEVSDERYTLAIRAKDRRSPAFAIVTRHLLAVEYRPP